MLKIAVLLPCYNEAAAIGRVIADFRRALPQAEIYVYDNNSNDGSKQIAEAAGAIVRLERRQGKGYVMRRMFSDIEADVYVLCDADGTYDAGAAADLIDHLVKEGLDMVIGARRPNSDVAYRRGHEFGNVMLTSLVMWMFGGKFRDMLSGYRIFSNRFVKSFPMMSSGFEIETELTIHALELKMPVMEIETEFSERFEGSESKLNTFSDGFRILGTILGLLKQERPLMLFGVVALFLAVTSVLLAVPLLETYLQTGQVPRFPTAILATGMMLLAYLSLFSGMILDTVTRGRQEAKRLRYLQVPGIQAATRPRDLKVA